MKQQRWGIAPLLVVALVAGACSLAPAESDAALGWCQSHEVEVLLADQAEDREDAVRLIRGAATARTAHRIQAETRFLFGYGQIENVSETPLQTMRQLEAYAEDSEDSFAGFNEDEWLALVEDTVSHSEACNLAYSAHLEIGDRHEVASSP